MGKPSGVRRALFWTLLATLCGLVAVGVTLYRLADERLIVHQVLSSEAVPCAADTFLHPEEADLMTDSDSECRLLVGPVLGPVTQDSAAVLLEVNRDASIRLTLTPEEAADHADTPAPQHMTLELRAETPRVFRFRGNLQPETYYRISVSGCNHRSQNALRSAEIIHRFLQSDPSIPDAKRVEELTPDYLDWLILVSPSQEAVMSCSWETMRFPLMSRSSSSFVHTGRIPDCREGREPATQLCWFGAPTLGFPVLQQFQRDTDSSRVPL